jgi:hypothetical protein
MVAVSHTLFGWKVQINIGQKIKTTAMIATNQYNGDQPITQTQLVQANRTVERLLGMGKTKQTQLIYEAGIEWVEHRYRINRERIPQWLNSNAFWKWWKIQWYVRNLELLKQNQFDINDSSLLTKTDRQYMVQLYDEKHEEGIHHLYPSGSLMTAVVIEHHNKIN